MKENHTPTPWKLIFTPGKDSKECYDPESEPYDLALAEIVSTTKFTGAKRYNEKTKEWDIPVPLTITDIAWDDRDDKENYCLANADFIVRAVNNFEELLEAAKEAIYWGLDSIRRDQLKKAIEKAEKDL